MWTLPRIRQVNLNALLIRPLNHKTLQVAWWITRSIFPCISFGFESTLGKPLLLVLFRQNLAPQTTSILLFVQSLADFSDFGSILIILLWLQLVKIMRQFAFTSLIIERFDFLCLGGKTTFDIIIQRTRIKTSSAITQWALYKTNFLGRWLIIYVEIMISLVHINNLSSSNLLKRSLGCHLLFYFFVFLNYSWRQIMVFSAKWGILFLFLLTLIIVVTKDLLSRQVMALNLHLFSKRLQLFVWMYGFILVTLICSYGSIILHRVVILLFWPFSFYLGMQFTGDYFFIVALVF